MTTPVGSDRRLVTHPAPDGAADTSTLGWRPRVLVIGAGIAGLAAATGLAERGVDVEIREQQPHLGGRLASWTEYLDDGTPVSMSRGFHAFFRQYYNLRALLRRADPRLRQLVPVEDYPLLDRHGRRDTFRGLPRTPPWNALAFALRSPTFTARDLIRLNVRAAAPLAAVSVPRVYAQLDDLDAETFLRRINFPAAARHLAFDVFSRSFFSRPDQLSAAELATMFHLYFLGSSEGLIFDVPACSFDASLWAPWSDYLERRGVQIRTSAPVDEIRRHRDGFGVHSPRMPPTNADGIVLATDVDGVRRLVAASPTLGDSSWRHRVTALKAAPPFVVLRLWLDRPLAADRPAFLATGGLSPLDNVSVLERFEREAADWAHQHGGSVVELHAYATEEPSPTRDSANPTSAMRERLIDRLTQVYPEFAAARIVGESCQVRQDCPHFGVGSFASRPSVRTPVHGLTLAGDGIRIDLPVALMERAASTGLHAANTLLHEWGLAGHELYSVPTEGRFSPPLRKRPRKETTTS